MTKKTTKSAKPSSDLKEIVGFIRAGLLEDYIRKLDASDVLGSIDKVPHSIIRLLSVLVTASDLESVIQQLGATDRKPVKTLLAACAKHDAHGFVAALIREQAANKGIRDRLGITIDTSNEVSAKVHNSITSLDVRPVLILQSSSLYCTASLFRGDDMLFRSDLEVHELLWLARGLLDGTVRTLEALIKTAPDVELNLSLTRCEKELKQIRSFARELPPLFAKLPNANSPGSTRTPRTRNKSKKQPRLGVARAKTTPKKKKKNKTKS